MTSMIRREYRIRELPDGRWLWLEMGRYYKAAALAYAATQRDAKRIMKYQPGAILVQAITWETTTGAGRLVVEAFK